MKFNCYKTLQRKTLKYCFSNCQICSQIKMKMNEMRLSLCLLFRNSFVVIIYWICISLKCTIVIKFSIICIIKNRKYSNSNCHWKCLQRFKWWEKIVKNKISFFSETIFVKFKLKNLCVMCALFINIEISIIDVFCFV